MKLELFAVKGTVKKSVMSQELSQTDVDFHLENGLKDLKKLVSLYVHDKKSEYRFEIDGEGINFVGNKFAASLTTVLQKVVANEMQKHGRGAELKTIELGAQKIEEGVKISAELIETLRFADMVNEGKLTGIENLAQKFIVQENEAAN